MRKQLIFSSMDLKIKPILAIPQMMRTLKKATRRLMLILMVIFQELHPVLLILLYLFQMTLKKYQISFLRILPQISTPILLLELELEE